MNNYCSLMNNVCPVTESTRWIIARLAGLSHIRWTLIEKLGSHDLLNTDLFIGSELGATRPRLLVLTTPGERFRSVSPAAGLPLIAQLLPYPFTMFSKEYRALCGTDLHVEGGDPHFSDRIDAMFAAMEMLAHSVEILWIQVLSQDVKLDLIVHSVRRQIVQVGVLDPNFGGFLGLPMKGNPKPGRMDELFSTRSLFLPVNLNGGPELEDLNVKSFEVAILQQLNQSVELLKTGSMAL